MFIRATLRNRVTTSIFHSTLAICFLMVGANSVLPCPVDNVLGNDAVIDERIKKANTKARADV